MKKEILEKASKATEAAISVVDKAGTLVLAKAIKRIRNQTGLSQAAFSKRYNIPLNTIHNWEQGINKPPEYVVELLGRVVDIDYPRVG